MMHCHANRSPAELLQTESHIHKWKKEVVSKVTKNPHMLLLTTTATNKRPTKVVPLLFLELENPQKNHTKHLYAFSDQHHDQQ